MTGFAIRFFGAGLIVGGLPLVAARFGDRVGGWLLMAPIVTASGLIALGVARGAGAVQVASLSALTAVPVVVVFLLLVHVVARAAS